MVKNVKSLLEKVGYLVKNWFIWFMPARTAQSANPWITLFPLDTALVRKISKGHFFKDIQNSFHWVIDIGLEHHQKNVF